MSGCVCVVFVCVWLGMRRLRLSARLWVRRFRVCLVVAVSSSFLCFNVLVFAQVALLSLCRDEALKVIRNSLKGQGLDAWWRLSQEYEPSNEQSNLRHLNICAQRSKIGNTSTDSIAVGRAMRGPMWFVGSRCNTQHCKSCRSIWSSI